MKRVVLALLGMLLASEVYAGSVNRRVIAEIDPVAPASAGYEEQTHKITTSKFGANVDFNVGGVLSTGPELWSGSFVAKGAETSEPIRREDLYPGERHKINAMRLRWTFSFWEVPSSMRGWYVKTGYSFAKIDSRANRYDEDRNSGDAIPSGVILSQDPNDQTDLITDERHGAVLGIGNRWLFFKETLTATVGMSFTSNFKRKVSVDSKDIHAREDYEHMISDLPDTRISDRPTPELNFSFGYAF